MGEEENSFLHMSSMIVTAYKVGLKNRLKTDIVNAATGGKTSFVVERRILSEEEIQQMINDGIDIADAPDDNVIIDWSGLVDGGVSSWK